MKVQANVDTRPIAVEPTTDVTFGGLCPNCLEVICECATVVKPRRVDNNSSSPKNTGVGRGPSGKLRNFGAMAEGKIEKVYEQLMDELDNGSPDHEAIRACEEAMEDKGLNTIPLLP
jgi:hypothetical protein